LDAHEQPSDAIQREVLEETGLTLSDLQLHSIRTVGRHLEIIYCAVSSGEAQIRSREIYRLGWFRSDDLPVDIAPSQAAMVRDVLKTES
jgi:8-oxo-dGTP pyrophosphatase MutT (NUDIX family)